MMRPVSLSLSLLAFALVLGVTSRASADDTIRHPGDHPSYAVEVEPHLLVGWDNLLPGASFGAGARVGIPIVQNGFVPTINNSVAISFGLDVVHYGGSCQGYNCSANFLYFPAALQWNFFVAQRWSVFGEPGLYLYHGFIDTCPAGVVCRDYPSDTGLRPSLYLGGRYHINEKISLTMRIGYPTFSFGVSWFL
jgi:hypothetical protein